MTADVELDLGRELIQTASGEPFVAVGSQLVRDRGWGVPPSAATADDVEPGALEATTVLELVRVAGLHRVARRPLDEAVVLLPGFLVQQVVRRALDLELGVTYRPVRLHALFDEATPDTAVIELSLRVPDGHLPAAFLAAVARNPFTVVCRRAGPAGGLLIEHDAGSALDDHHLAAIVDEGTWVLADRHFGCWRLQPTTDAHLDGAALVCVSDALALTSDSPPPSDLAIGKLDLQVVPARTSGERVDGVLLEPGDLESVALLLEGHPLADIALIVPGKDRHLLIAPGGVLERVPVGELLYCLGPGPLYLPLGTRTRPTLPPSARRELFHADERNAVVLTPNAAFAFGLEHRRPVWTLWVGDLPQMEAQLPTAVERALSALDTPVPTPQPPTPPEPAPPRRNPGLARGWEQRFRRNPPTPPPPPVRTWQDEALEAELAGDLARAAELHERNGDPLRAARLYERAARG